jgi:hypothetical protein
MAERAGEYHEAPMSFGPIGSTPIASPFFLAGIAPSPGRPMRFTAIPESFTFNAERQSYSFTMKPDSFVFRGVPE